MKKFNSQEIKEFVSRPYFNEKIILDKNKSWPKISIITPSLNQGEFIEDTILSVKNQDYPYIEHIIIDGGSTDNTLEILRKYEGVYNMKWVSEKDEGQSDAINKGIDMVNGDIIGWLNSDDTYLFKDTISEVVQTFGRYKEFDVLFGDIAFMNRQGEILRFYAYQNYDYNKLLSYRFNLGQPAVFFKSNVFKKNKLRKDLHYVMDYELWLRLGKKKYKFLHIFEPLAGFRVYPEAKSFKEKEKKLLFEREKIIEEFGNKTNTTSIIVLLLDKIVRGGRARIGGLMELIKYKYLKKENLTFRGKYSSFPLDILRQVFYMQ